MTNNEIRELNTEIEELENNYWELKGIYEKEKANILLYTDWGEAIGKAKPTVAEKDAYVELQLGNDRFDYRIVRATLDMKKRLFQILLKELGDDE